MGILSSGRSRAFLILLGSLIPWTSVSSQDLPPPAIEWLREFTGLGHAASLDVQEIPDGGLVLLVVTSDSGFGEMLWPGQDLGISGSSRLLRLDGQGQALWQSDLLGPDCVREGLVNWTPSHGFVVVRTGEACTWSGAIRVDRFDGSGAFQRSCRYAAYDTRYGLRCIQGDEAGNLRLGVVSEAYDFDPVFCWMVLSLMIKPDRDILGLSPIGGCITFGV